MENGVISAQFGREKQAMDDRTLTLSVLEILENTHVCIPQ